MDPKKVEAYRVATKSSGTWWIIGKEKSDSDSTPDPKRIEPKRRQTTDSKPLPPTPVRRATVAAVPTTPKRRGSTMSVNSVSTTSPSQLDTPNQTPGGSKFFPSLPRVTSDMLIPLGLYFSQLSPPSRTYQPGSLMPLTLWTF